MPTENAAAESQIQANGVARDPKVSKPAPGRDGFLSARDEMLKAMDEQIESQRSTDDETFFQSADPRALAMAAEMGRESRGEPNTFDRGKEAVQVEDEGQQVEQEARTAEPATRQTADPLADYIVESNGQQMFKAVIDGKVRLIPLEQARAQLQKHVAGEARLQQAAERQKNLDAREATIRATEAALKARTVKTVPVDDTDLERESIELVRSLVSEPEAVAAQKLSKVLTKIRASQPQVDVDAIGQHAATVARQAIAEESTQRTLGESFEQFTKDYPDIAGDSDLFALADRKTEAILAEHPDWSPGKVMAEAGTQVRAWVAKMSGKPAPRAQTGEPNRRQQVKQALRPMPQARTMRPAAATDPNEGTSPQDAMAEIRKARGQAY